MSKKPFSGIHVLDFTWAGVGSFCVNYLAWYGATVVKIENKNRPDITRCSPPYKDGKPGFDRSLYFSWTHPAKKLDVTVNLNNPHGVEVIKKLVDWADVVVESFVAGTMEKWGLDYDSLIKINPGIIMLRTCTHGQTGPLAKQPALGFTLTTLAGFNNLTGWPDRPTNELRGAYTDFIAPLFGGFALIAALDHKRRTGIGQCIDLSQHEASLQFILPLLLDASVNQRNPTPNGNDYNQAIPHGAYRCKGNDRWCAIGVFNEEQWAALCFATDRPEWAGSEAFTPCTNRYAHKQAIDDHLKRWTADKSPEEVMHRLQAVGVPAGLIANAKDMAENPQLGHYRFYNSLDHSEMGKCSFYQSPPFRLSEAHAEVAAPPKLGEHTDFVCRKILKLPELEIERLTQAGAFD